MEYDSPEIINIGWGKDYTIRELMSGPNGGYFGTLTWDASRPDRTRECWTPPTGHLGLAAWRLFAGRAAADLSLVPGTPRMTEKTALITGVMNGMEPTLQSCC